MLQKISTFHTSSLCELPETNIKLILVPSMFHILDGSHGSFKIKQYLQDLRENSGCLFFILLYNISDDLSLFSPTSIAFATAPAQRERLIF